MDDMEQPPGVHDVELEVAPENVPEIAKEATKETVQEAAPVASPEEVPGVAVESTGSLGNDKQQLQHLSRRITQEGLEWKDMLFGTEPRWIKDPNIPIIKHIVNQILNDDCEVEFFAQGAFNKLFTVRTSGGECSMMRVALPVDPKFKTLSEVATLEYVGKHTAIPVPRVLKYRALFDKELGFEWILMKFMAGKTLNQQWRSLRWSQKERLVKRVALCAVALFGQKSRCIGNLFPRLKPKGPTKQYLNPRLDPFNKTKLIISILNYSNSLKDATKPDSIKTPINPTKLEFIEDSEDVIVGRIVSMPFFWGDHITQKVPRGSFYCSYDWLSAQLTLFEHDARRMSLKTDDEDDLEDAEDLMNLIRRLRLVLPTYFPREPQTQPEIFALAHDDLNDRNILVSDDGDLTAIIDWECTSTLPLYKTCQVPEFLQGRSRLEKPNPDEYARDERGEPTDTFEEHLREWECTKLRTVFVEEMQSLDPEWFDIWNKNRLLADLELAVRNCSNPWYFRRMNRWLDDGMKESLADVLRG